MARTSSIVGGPRSRVLCRAECAPRQECRGVLPLAVPARGVDVEPARQAHVRDARCAGEVPRPRGGPHEGRRLRAQLPSRCARATQMGQRGELNLGQLVREHHVGDCVLVGFTTHMGTVTAADDWDEPAQRKQVRPSLVGQLRGVVPRRGHRPLRARRTGQPRLATTAAGAGNRRDLPAGDRATEPLFPRPTSCDFYDRCSAN
jgi:hypothetical protein